MEDMNKKIIVILFMLLFLTTLNPSLKFTFVKASPDTIYVPDEHATIQGAIDAANNGDVIIVRDGSYSENLVINGITDLTLRSENGAGSTTISGTSGVVINIQSNSDDFTLGGEATPHKTARIYHARNSNPTGRSNSGG